jgi:hypothetical protein
MDGFNNTFDEREEEVRYDPYFVEGMPSGYSKIAPKSQVDPKTIIKKQNETKKTEPAKSSATTPKEEPKPDIQTIFEDHTRRQQAIPDKDIYAEIFARHEAQREEMKKSAAEDKNLALLAAGLGIMGGTSPYAFANIGQGAMKGVEYLGASKARRASEMNALSASDLKALYYGEENKRKQRALTEGLSERAIDNLKDYEIRKSKEYFPTEGVKTPKQIEAFENFKRTDPIYRRLLESVGMPTATPSKPRDYDPIKRTFG